MSPWHVTCSAVYPMSLHELFCRRIGPKMVYRLHLSEFQGTGTNFLMHILKKNEIGIKRWAFFNR